MVIVVLVFTTSEIDRGNGNLLWRHVPELLLTCIDEVNDIIFRSTHHKFENILNHGPTLKAGVEDLTAQYP